MAEEDKWVTFDSSDDAEDDEEESLSLSNLPVDDPDNKNPENPRSSPPKDEHFEFRFVGGNGDDSSKQFATMCAADEVFFHGQLLPLGPARPVSRCDSAASLGFESSGSVSRSVSSSSSDGPPARRIWSSALYAYPSPSPRVPATRNSVGGGGRRSTGSAPAGWGLLRIGVVMAPEMEPPEFRLRRRSGGAAAPTVVKKGGATWRLFAGGGLMGCRSSPEVAVSGERSKKKGERRNRVAGTTERRERMFEWLEELAVGKEPLIN